MPLELTVNRRTHGIVVIEVDGALTLGLSLRSADAQVQQLIEDGSSRLVLNLDLCPYLDSAGLGFLVHTNGLAEAHAGAMRLCHVSPRVMTLLRMTRVHELLSCDADCETSIKTLANRWRASA